MLAVDQRLVRGIRVRLINSRADIRTDQVIERLDSALGLVEQYAPRCYRRLSRDVAGFRVERFACRGAFFPQSREILVELTFTVNPEHGLPEIASSILHEATHARVAHRCGPLPESTRAREERLCRRAEIAFGLSVPGGEIVLARARAALNLTPEEVAPTVDWREAARRVASVDADAASIPPVPPGSRSDG
jgi:hypothetical protein